MVALAPFGGWPARYDLAFDYPTNLDTGLLAFVPRDEFWSYSNETQHHQYTKIPDFSIRPGERFHFFRLEPGLSWTA